MSVEQKLPPKNQIVYPESDGKPMADNTKQFRWINTIHNGFDWLYENDPNVFVSPLTGVRFGLNGKDLELITAEGELFVNSMEARRQTRRAEERAKREKARADEEKARADQERAAKEQAELQIGSMQAQLDELMRKLREKGIDPEKL
jgi:hypothetical protein